MGHLTVILRPFIAVYARVQSVMELSYVWYVPQSYLEVENFVLQ